MKNRLAMLMLFAFACTACVEQESATTADWMLENASNYLEDASWRRAQLEASLWQPELPYARKRLAGYALGDAGWDLLPEIDTHVTLVGEGGAARELLPEATPTTRDQWLALGERVFHLMPMRRDTYLAWLADHPELWEQLGVERDADGNARGLVRFTDARGDRRVGATCALCHAAGGLPGRASRALDLGLGRDMYSRAVHGRETDYDTWGAGRVDVTDDQVTDALSIPDLWGVDKQEFMNVSGAIKLTTPAALAIRFETQYVVGHSLEARPDRRITWALMMYVMSLEAPPKPPSHAPRGEQLFMERCASCHQPDRGFSGGLVAAEALPGSEPLAAFSRLRGTGSYKITSLIGVADGAPYLHDGSVSTLREVVAAHPAPNQLPSADVAELVRFLETL